MSIILGKENSVKNIGENDNIEKILYIAKFIDVKIFKIFASEHYIKSKDIEEMFDKLNECKQNYIKDNKVKFLLCYADGDCYL